MTKQSSSVYPIAATKFPASTPASTSSTSHSSTYQSGPTPSRIITSSSKSSLNSTFTDGPASTAPIIMKEANDRTPSHTPATITYSDSTLAPTKASTTTFVPTNTKEPSSTIYTSMEPTHVLRKPKKSRRSAEVPSIPTINEHLPNPKFFTSGGFDLIPGISATMLIGLAIGLM
ncbi:unnamed protein product [Hydatigera taeniaeformis]|uniref:Flocculation protein FLO11-like n=1 Tax=Hydatigena taeniaeformis TaxID=6205 RepID=A0A0R3WVA7_HYDTA|nr:unnamed protein product [Hydatigera taeniaeformis]